MDNYRAFLHRDHTTSPWTINSRFNISVSILDDVLPFTRKLCTRYLNFTLEHEFEQLRIRQLEHHCRVGLSSHSFLRFNLFVWFQLSCVTSQEMQRWSATSQEIRQCVMFTCRQNVVRNYFVSVQAEKRERRLCYVRPSPFSRRSFLSLVAWVVICIFIEQCSTQCRSFSLYKKLLAQGTPFLLRYSML